ncbi:hypothetical protein SAMN04488128_105512 [Chitinophaga eiseniae]|uniref:Uncharacterized protein n=1 Tax=Chitinophaga eiseniae TaxID=634771 RepID=A0A1T4TMR0_9BACT|nr:hypothetical protein [Chitinophaga eiseniae]SKA41765.1 hypothetical protein SAMN04488128_105512 [Chitinophaga eiseniae]
MKGPLLLENKGIRTAEWFIPPFHVQEGELVILNLKNPIHGTAVQDFFVNLITGKTTHSDNSTSSVDLCALVPAVLAPPAV